MARKICRQYSSDFMDGALCVHKDVRDYLSPVARAKAVELGATAPAGTAKAYAAFLQWSLEHPLEAINVEQKVPCCVHDRLCPMMPMLPNSGNNDDFDSEMEPAPVRVTFAGVTCNAWSRQGARAGLDHPSEEAHNAWITKRKAMALLGLEDFVFVECV